VNDILENLAANIFQPNDYNHSYNSIYKIHKYWARKPWYNVEQYIQRYSKAGDTVLDPFCGSGCTGLEAIINGRNFIGQDLNPSAIHVSKGTLFWDVDLPALNKAFDKICKACKETIMSLYRSPDNCEVCGGILYYKHINNGPAFAG